MLENNSSFWYNRSEMLTSVMISNGIFMSMSFWSCKNISWKSGFLWGSISYIIVCRSLSGSTFESWNSLQVCENFHHMGRVGMETHRMGFYSRHPPEQRLIGRRYLTRTSDPYRIHRTKDYKMRKILCFWLLSACWRICYQDYIATITRIKNTDRSIESS